MEHVDVVVAGAGVVGLAVARALANSGRDVWVLEATDGVGNGASSRNSEVIHAGIYYPPNSLKARLCAQGKTLLYNYCADRGIAYQRIGKLIVATAATEIPALRQIEKNAQANGLDDLTWLDSAQISATEPALRAEAALWSPSTGIIDSHSLMLGYQGDAEAAGASVICRAPILGGTLAADGIVLDIGGDSAMRLRCDLLVNCAGLGATALAQSISGFPAATIPALHLCKGSYFTLTKPAPFRHLIYPVPEPGGLGIHLTLDLAGQARFGPDVEWVSEVDYAVDSPRAASFYPAIRRYWPGLEDSALQPAYSGIRAKISAPGEIAADFRIDDASFHGIPRVINLFGIESPGLTASLAIGAYVASRAAALRG